jgi:peptidoglycan/LPS O-acetylase OafA/YrhL
MHTSSVNAEHQRGSDAAERGVRSAEDSLARIPALDGMRGLAVLSVVVFHSAYVAEQTTLTEYVWGRIVRFGWVGVDAFFVLSGFLITGILWRTRSVPGYFGNFYLRRALRIFPLYYLFLVVMVVLLPALEVVSAHHAEALQRGQAWYWTYTTNILIAKTGSWGATPLNTSHLWSLAIEEQFYLIWPLVVFLLSRRSLLALCATALVASLVVRTIVHLQGAELSERIALYVLGPTRVDGLMTGSLVALLAVGERGLRPHLRWLRHVAWAGLVAALACHVFWGSKSSALSGPMQTIGYTGLAWFFAAVIARMVGGEPRGVTRLGAILASPVPRFFGRYSYAIYLFHYPLVLLLERSQVGPVQLSSALGSKILGQIAFCLGLTLASSALAIVSWSLLEGPCLGLRGRFAKSSLVPRMGDPACPK